MLREALGAEAVVVVGASEDSQQFGGRAFGYLRERFAGRVYPVNPRRTTVQGTAAFRTVGDAPHATLAVIALPAAAVPRAIEECGAAGIGWAVVFASGFADQGADGLRLQENLLRIAHDAGVRVIGPNSMGIVNVASGLAATFASRLGHVDLRPGGLALVSQSGATGSALLSDLVDSAVPCRYFVHTGNEADVGVSDVLLAYVEDPAVEVVVAYLETVRHPAAFTEALTAAARRDLPVVALVAGATPSGAAAAASHTGSLVQPHDALVAVLEATGVIRAGSPSELVDAAKCLALGQRPVGRRTAVVTVTGGGGVLQADAASVSGLELPAPSPDLRDRLRRSLPPFGSTANPIDLTGAPVTHPSILADAMAAIAESAEYDIVSLVLAAGERAAPALTDVAADFASRSPLVVTWEGVDPSTRRALAERGVPTFADPVHAVRALAAVARSAAREVKAPPAATGVPAASTPESVPRDLEGLGRWLSRHGVPVAPTVYLQTPAETALVPEVLGTGPYVAKLDFSGVLHRSDVGGVRLGIGSVDALTQVVADLLDLATDTRGTEGASRKRAGDRDATSGGARVQVQRHVPARHETLIGLRRDDRFGWMLAIGYGGVLTEIVDEVAVVPAPASEATCGRMIGSLFGGRWVTHRRGLGKEGAAALAAVAATLSSLIGSIDCSELELNPVIVHEDSAIAVDWVAAG